MIATGRSVGLAEWIIDDTCLVVSVPVGNQGLCTAVEEEMCQYWPTRPIGGHYIHTWCTYVCPSGKQNNTTRLKQKRATTLHGTLWVTLKLPDLLVFSFSWLRRPRQTACVDHAQRWRRRSCQQRSPATRIQPPWWSPSLNSKRNKTGVVNDPPGQPIVRRIVKIVLFCLILESGDERTPRVETVITTGRAWVGLVDKNEFLHWYLYLLYWHLWQLYNKHPIWN